MVNEMKGARPRGRRVLMRLVEIRGDDYSVDELVMKPGAGGEELRWTGTRVEYRPRTPGGVIEVEGRRRLLPTARATILDKGQWHRLSNPTKYPWAGFMTFKPPWNPQRAFFRVGGREFRGDQVWFELRTHLGDRTERAMYQLHQLSAKLGKVSVRLAPKARSLESFHKNATVVVTGVEGSGTIRINGKPQQIRAKQRVVIEPGQRYQLLNPTEQMWQVRQIHRPQWEPDDTFYVYNKFLVPAYQVWFEFTV